MSTKSEIKSIVLSALSAMTVKRCDPSAGRLGGCTVYIVSSEWENVDGTAVVVAVIHSNRSGQVLDNIGILKKM